ncbi:E3 ubiquitin-protein ligase XIAP isoform X1 [Oryzias melastigma]|uniref:E3 ubiquitin-protein ligase XIAP n=1 Tax=Oryzias melastigma TaxID=30732 RepID=A0A3B3C514_ORYME|nr:E3 ubiquitin-protein ligase XIAP isoform X1 [Oryzias melastigma]
MCDLSQDGNWESDSTTDYSQIKNRLKSFCNSSWSQKVSPERLALAGFFFTGDSDRVRCFSCQETVENWSQEDAPVDRHKEVSPSCMFLRCTHNNSFKSNPHMPLSNGSLNDETAAYMDYQLRTKAVVDETPYPRNQNMKSEEARLKTFSSWPSSAPVRPRDLAQAGFFYLGKDDRVQCFCCGGKLSGWEPGDSPWREHETHYSHCFYVLGHDVGNVPLPEDAGEDEETGSRQRHRKPSSNMENLEERLATFARVQHPIDHELLAQAGFYSKGEGDKVLCFKCGGGLTDWDSEDDPWEEHAKYYPGCSFLLSEKGQEFVNKIQLQGPKHTKEDSEHQNGFLEEEKVENPLEELEKLRREKRCKICLDKSVGIVFIPCGHLASCKECSDKLDQCPICCATIAQKIQTFIA